MSQGKFKKQNIITHIARQQKSKYRLEFYVAQRETNNNKVRLLIVPSTERHTGKCSEYDMLYHSMYKPFLEIK